MKIQDLMFILSLVGFLAWRRWSWLWWAGVASLIMAIPLFATWTFFTGQRLVWYAILFLMTFVFYSALKLRIIASRKDNDL